MSTKTGRPTINPKQNRESFRLSDSDMEKLKFCMKEMGMTKTDIIRKGIELVYQEAKKNSRCAPTKVCNCYFTQQSRKDCIYILSFFRGKCKKGR